MCARDSHTRAVANRRDLHHRQPFPNPLNSRRDIEGVVSLMHDVPQCPGSYVNETYGLAVAMRPVASSSSPMPRFRNTFTIASTTSASYSMPERCVIRSIASDGEIRVSCALVIVS